ncbi:WRKY domain, partial [Dillenia turbinata]
KQEDILFNFNDLVETEAVLNELEQLYKPFYPVDIALSPLQTISSGTTSGSSASFKLEPQDLHKQQSFSASTLVASTSANHPNHESPQQQPKRRKNKLKRVVQQMTTDGFSSDMWAWRKYGQKPIKGSPYPRSYYRCSSCKGCSARKQVERCRSDPRMFIITYMSEHNHSLPTRRNSLAGSTRHRFTSSPNNKLPNSPSTTAVANQNSPSTSAALSPVASLEESKEENTREIEDDEEQVGNVPQNDDTIMFGNDDSFWCWGLEDFEGLNNSLSAALGHGFSDQFDESFSRPWSVDEQGL